MLIQLYALYNIAVVILVQIHPVYNKYSLLLARDAVSNVHVFVYQIYYMYMYLYVSKTGSYGLEAAH